MLRSIGTIALLLALPLASSCAMTELVCFLRFDGPASCKGRVALGRGTTLNCGNFGLKPLENVKCGGDCVAIEFSAERNFKCRRSLFIRSIERIAGVATLKRQRQNLPDSRSIPMLSARQVLAQCHAVRLIRENPDIVDAGVDGGFAQVRTEGSISTKIMPADAVRIDVHFVRRPFRVAKLNVPPERKFVFLRRIYVKQHDLVCVATERPQAFGETGQLIKTVAEHDDQAPPPERRRQMPEQIAQVRFPASVQAAQRSY